MRIIRGYWVVVVAGAMLAGCGQNEETFQLWSNYGNSVTTTATPPTVTLQVPTAPITEGDTLVLSVQLSNAFNQSITVPFSVTGGTAGINDVTFAAASPVVIAAGATSASITITVVDDLFEEEPDVETLTVSLGTPSSGALGTPSSGTASISDNDTDNLDGTLSGRASDAATGLPLGSVSVRAGATTTATAGTTGRYSITPTPAASVIVDYLRDGYAPQNRTTEGLVDAEAAMRLNVPMVPVPVPSPTTFDPTAVAAITVAGTTAQVSLGANALETSGDAAPTGSVTPSVTPLAAGSDLGVLPGIYRGVGSGGTTVPLETFGGLDVSFVDSATIPNVLRLDSGQTATIRIPVSARTTDRPLTLGLWSFDAATGLWVEEGTASLVGTTPNDYYEGTISHAGTWTAASTYTASSVTGCVTDLTGSPVPNATVIAEGTTYTGNTRVQTDAAGVFTVPVKSGESAFLQANRRSAISNAANVSVGSAGQTVGDCLVLVVGVSVRLTWGATPNDLDSHMLGPNLNDHTYYVDQGSLTQAPFVSLDVDDVTGFGPEVTTISRIAANRQYRFYVHTFPSWESPGQTASPAKVELFLDGEATSFTPPLGETTSTDWWHVFDLTSDASCLLTVSTGTGYVDVEPTNPNPDNAATFCAN